MLSGTSKRILVDANVPATEYSDFILPRSTSGRIAMGDLKLFAYQPIKFQR